MRKILTLTTFAAMLAGCSTSIFDIEEDGTKHMLSLHTSAEQGELIYPFKIYAYSGEELAGELNVASPTDEIAMSLPTGSYDIYAVSGDMNFSNGGYATEPLLTGKSSVTLGKNDETVALTLRYAVARLNIALTEVPEGITDVKVNVGPLHSSIDTKGTLSGNTKITLQCNKKDDMWLSDTVYVLPSVSDNVTLEISHGNGNNDVKTSYTYSYPHPILAGSPYNFKGSYTSGVSLAKLSLVVDTEGWGEDVDCPFDFGEGAGKENVIPSDISAFSVDELPTACSAWNGHVVATIDEDGNALLLSLKEWEVESISEAESLTNYVENGDINITGWVIPTNIQAEELSKTYLAAKCIPLNNLIKTFTDSNEIITDEGHYYICADGKYTYRTQIVSSQNINNYHLRLVKPVKFIKQ